MGKFKDKLDSLAGGEPYPNNLNNPNNAKCEPEGRVIDFKSKKEVPPGVTPPTEGVPPTTEDICVCLGDKLDQIDSDIQGSYDSGPSFNTGKLFTQAYTPAPIDSAITSPSPGTTGFYDAIPVAQNRGMINAPRLWVVADPDAGFDILDPFLYVRVSNGGSSTFNQEVPVRVGEDWGFRSVYELRIRSSFEGQQYRITTDPHRTTFVSTVVNIPSGPVSIVTPPVANRPAFITRNISVGVADSILPNIPIPNGFALVVTANIDNLGTSRIYVSEINATVVADRATLAPGDAVRLNITTSDLIHVAANVAGQSIDILVEQ